jgi:hypothetical protein
MEPRYENADGDMYWRHQYRTDTEQTLCEKGPEGLLLALPTYDNPDDDAGTIYWEECPGCLAAEPQ